MIAALVRLAAIVVTLIPGVTTFTAPDGSSGQAGSTAVESSEPDTVPLVVVSVWAECDPAGPFPFQYLGPPESMPAVCRVIGEVTAPG